MALTEAVADLLIAKGVCTADDLRRALETTVSHSPADGARVVARAWVDPAYRERLFRDVNAAAAESAWTPAVSRSGPCRTNPACTT